MIRKATEKDISAVAAIYEHIHGEEEAGRASIGWARGVYPTRDTAQAALECGELYVCEENGEVTAAAIINAVQVPCYADCPWQFDAEPDEVLVLHTLVVEPACSGRGTASRFAAFYEERARSLGCTVLRIDTNEKNRAARSLYKKLGYREAGIVPCEFNSIPNVHLVCLEKKL